MFPPALACHYFTSYHFYTSPNHSFYVTHTTWLAALLQSTRDTPQRIGIWHFQHFWGNVNSWISRGHHQNWEHHQNWGPDWAQSGLIGPNPDWSGLIPIDQAWSQLIGFGWVWSEHHQNRVLNWDWWKSPKSHHHITVKAHHALRQREKCKCNCLFHH
jgi:hypothetical protein